MSIISGFQVLFYLILLIGTVFYLAICWGFDRRLDNRHRGVALGLIFLPLGLILPYATAGGIGWLFCGGQPLLPVSDWSFSFVFPSSF